MNINVYECHTILESDCIIFIQKTFSLNLNGSRQIDNTSPGGAPRGKSVPDFHKTCKLGYTVIRHFTGDQRIREVIPAPDNLGTRIQISPQECESSVCFCTKIGNMCIPFQIVCDSYTQVFYAYYIFQYSTLKGVISLYLYRLLSAASCCIPWVEISFPIS